MNTLYVTYPGAFLAGIMSFASPCILPLVPAYLSFLSGVSFDEAIDPRRERAVARRVLVSATWFVLGFIIIFVLLGASATVIGGLLSDRFALLEKVAGIVIVAFGLHYTGLLPIRWLNRDARFHPTSLQAGPFRALVLGVAFAFGWTPCVGPVLATILALAASTGSIAQGVLLLALYGVGIGIPFLIAAAAIGSFLRLSARFRRSVRWLELGVGGMLIVTGALIFMGSISNVGGWLLRVFPGLGRIG